MESQRPFIEDVAEDLAGFYVDYDLYNEIISCMEDIEVIVVDNIQLVIDLEARDL